MPDFSPSGGIEEVLLGVHGTSALDRHAYPADSRLNGHTSGRMKDIHGMRGLRRIGREMFDDETTEENLHGPADGGAGDGGADGGADGG
ncbi:MAG TPA: hypothetical protein PLT68_08870, partial [Actinomycetota bacterium]|nr:hypothetical protein [Actinomycetota bacterium]